MTNEERLAKLAKWFSRAEAALTRKEGQRALKKAEKHYRKLNNETQKDDEG